MNPVQVYAVSDANVEEWVSGSVDNHGLLLLSYPGNGLTLRGSGYEDASVHPRLDVEFSPTPQGIGDFNHDAIVDLLDVNLLGTAIASGTNDADFDLNLDQLTNRADPNLLLGGGLIDSGNKLNGDSDFDGTVGFGDFLILSFNFGLKNRTWGEP